MARVSLLCFSALLLVIVGSAAAGKKDKFCPEDKEGLEELCGVGKQCIDTEKCNKRGECFMKPKCVKDPCHTKDCGSRLCRFKQHKCDDKGNCKKLKAKCFKDPCAKKHSCDTTQNCIPSNDCTDKKEFCVPQQKCVTKPGLVSAFPCVEIKDRAQLDNYKAHTFIGQPLPRTPQNAFKLTGFEFYAKRTGTLNITMHVPKKGGYGNNYLRWRMVDVVVTKVGYNKVDMVPAYDDDDLPSSVFGFYTDGKGMIPFDYITRGTGRCYSWLYTPQFKKGYLPEGKMWGLGSNCRDYSFRAIIELDSDVGTCSIKY